MTIIAITTDVNIDILPFLRSIAPTPSYSPYAPTERIIDSLRNEIDKSLCTCAESTTTNRKTAVNALERFFNEALTDKFITAGTINPDHVKAFERWCLNKGMKPGYVALHMRCLRSLFNRINGRGGLLFKNVRTSTCQTEKRAVSEETIRRLKDLALTLPSDMIARDVFLCCFYGLGIPLIDLLHLRKSQLKDNHITYYRHKTNRKVRVKVEPELEALLEKYASEESPYLLPFLKSTDRTESMKEYRRFYRRYMRALARISDRLGLDSRLTSYTPRHSWASIAFRKGVDINTISQALGHANTNITMVYIKGIEDDQLNDASRIVCDAVN